MDLNFVHFALSLSFLCNADKYLYPSITVTFTYRILTLFSFGCSDLSSALKKVAISRFTVTANASNSYKSKAKVSSSVLF